MRKLFLLILILGLAACRHNSPNDIVDCNACNRDGNIPGRCPLCGGTGMAFGARCFSCLYHPGYCYKCQGTGHILRAQLDDPSLRVPGDSDSPINPPATGTDRKVPCTYCNATGLVPVPPGIGHTQLHEGAASILCSTCQKVHCSKCTQHAVCSKCKGDKEISASQLY